MPIVSRANALLAAGLAVLAPVTVRTVATAADRLDAGDVRALDVSLASERAAYKAYGDALAANVMTPPVAAVIARFQSEHGLHRDAIVAALTQASQTPSTDPGTPAPESFRAEADVLAYAYALERAQAAAYVQTVGPYKNRDFATLAASILGVTTTRVALLGEALRSGAPYPTGLITA